MKNIWRNCQSNTVTLHCRICVLESPAFLFLAVSPISELQSHNQLKPDEFCTHVPTCWPVSQLINSTDWEPSKGCQNASGFFSASSEKAVRRATPTPTLLSLLNGSKQDCVPIVSFLCIYFKQTQSLQYTV